MSIGPPGWRCRSVASTPEIINNSKIQLPEILTRNSFWSCFSDPLHADFGLFAISIYVVTSKNSAHARVCVLVCRFYSHIHSSVYLSYSIWEDILEVIMEIKYGLIDRVAVIVSLSVSVTTAAGVIGRRSAFGSPPPNRASRFYWFLEFHGMAPLRKTIQLIAIQEQQLISLFFSTSVCINQIGQLHSAAVRHLLLWILLRSFPIGQPGQIL